MVGTKHGSTTVFAAIVLLSTARVGAEPTPSGRTAPAPAPAIAPHASWSTLSFSNGQSAAWYDTQGRKM
ncbi:MAG TPA: hypothetical protein PLF40_22015, partial [Kofleriaceae bacterium]|nr:hypothetical protein [Kofleriaceae bacterium]